MKTSINSLVTNARPIDYGLSYVYSVSLATYLRVGPPIKSVIMFLLHRDKFVKTIQQRRYSDL